MTIGNGIPGQYEVGSNPTQGISTMILILAKEKKKVNDIILNTYFFVLSC